MIMNDTTQTPLEQATPASDLCPPSSAPPPRRPGETPRAFGAFVAYYQLGQTRSLAAVAEALGENPDTLKVWSSRHRWRERIGELQTGLLANHLAAEQQLSTDWTRRVQEFRQQKWESGQKLLAAATCFLESFGDRELEKMPLAQVSRAIHIGNRVTGEALRGDAMASDPASSPLQEELIALLQKAYAPVAPDSNNTDQPPKPAHEP